MSNASSTSSFTVVPATTRVERLGLWACLALFGLAGFLLRAGLAVLWPTVQRADEVFQNLEPAYRLWTGWGVVTWEWRAGIRSWLFPGFLAGVMRVNDMLGLPHDAALPLIWAVLAAIASGVIVIGVVLGWRQSGLTGAVLCGVLCAFWPDLVYFGPKTLLEVQAGNLAVIAAGLASLGPAGRAWGWRMAAIGLLLGLAFDLRIQLMPALVLIALWTARDDLRGWTAMVAGAAPALAALGIVDALTWGSPFSSVWKNLLFNFVEGKSDLFGVEPMHWYVRMFALRYGAALVPLAVFFCVGAFRAPLLAAVAVVVVVSHSLIAHKELSFVYASLPAAVLTAGLGTAWVVDLLVVALRRPVRLRVLLGGASLAWLATCILTGYASEPFRKLGKPWEPLRTLWADVAARPDLCGLGLYGSSFWWGWTGGYSGLNRPVPILFPMGPEAFASARRGFNYLIASADKLPGLGDYQTLSCVGNYCLLRHEQTCAPVPEQEINAVFARSRQ